MAILNSSFLAAADVKPCFFPAQVETKIFERDGRVITDLIEKPKGESCRSVATLSTEIDPNKCADLLLEKADEQNAWCLQQGVWLRENLFQGRARSMKYWICYVCKKSIATK